jgi:diadenosine tetraphosphate (Ap4A) HIT family hydrolase
MGANPQPADCVFCDVERLNGILAETDHFLILADHAPLVEGHLLIIPRQHYACYGAVPADLEEELLAIKRRVAAFLRGTYRAPAFFEHGVFRQTVCHAHLHAIPLGAEDFHVDPLLARGGRRVSAPHDVRDWYSAPGPYFYVEQSSTDGAPAEAGVFPPELSHYFSALDMLRTAAGNISGWQPQPVRRLTGRAKIEALAAQWRLSSQHVVSDAQPHP